MSTANAITDGNGNMLYFANSGGLKSIDVRGNKRSIWADAITHLVKSTLGELIDIPGYNLLANHIIADGYSLNEVCAYGKWSCIKEICLANVTYRNEGYKIHHRKELTVFK